MHLYYFQLSSLLTSSFLFFNSTSTTEIYTLSLHDALPIFRSRRDPESSIAGVFHYSCDRRLGGYGRSEEHTLNSSHQIISYAVFCLKKKKIKIILCVNDQN